MDDGDMAEMREQQERDRALAIRKPTINKNGSCCSCGEMTEKLFCDADCAKDYEKVQDAHKRNGTQ